MPRKKQELNRADELLDELLLDCQSPEAILGKSGLLQQLTKCLVERALAGELNHHLQEADDGDSRNSRNGHSSKTVQSEYGELKLAILRVGASLSGGQSSKHLRAGIGTEASMVAEWLG